VEAATLNVNRRTLFQLLRISDEFSSQLNEHQRKANSVGCALQHPDCIFVKVTIGAVTLVFVLVSQIKAGPSSK
jgi:hypothetical protein